MHPRAGLEIRRRVPWLHAFVGREPRRRHRGTTRLATVSPRRNRGFSLRSWFTDVRDRRAGLRRPVVDQTIRLTATVSFRHFVPAITVGSRLEPQWWTAAQGRRQSRHQDNSLAAAGQFGRRCSTRNCHDAFCLQDSCNVVDQKIAAFGSGGLAAVSTICGQAGSHVPAPIFHPPSTHYLDMAGFADLKLMEWRSPAFETSRP